jgi:hypothetical protein
VPSDVRSWGQVIDICTGFESTRVVVSKLTDDIQDDELHALSSLFDNCQLLRRDPQTGKATFQFDTSRVPLLRLRILDGYTLHGHRISARLDIPLVNIHGKLDCTLHLSFAAESKTATLRYGNSATAYNMVTYLKSSHFKNERRSLHIYRPPANGYHPHRDIVKVEGLPADATTEDVRDFALHTGQVVSLETYGLSQRRAEKSIRQLLEPHGTLQELRFEQTPDGRWSNVYVQLLRSRYCSDSGACSHPRQSPDTPDTCPCQTQGIHHISYPSEAVRGPDRGGDVDPREYAHGHECQDQRSR